MNYVLWLSGKIPIGFFITFFHFSIYDFFSRSCSSPAGAIINKNVIEEKWMTKVCYIALRLKKVITRSKKVEVMEKSYGGQNFDWVGFWDLVLLEKSWCYISGGIDRSSSNIFTCSIFRRIDSFVHLPQRMLFLWNVDFWMRTFRFHIRILYLCDAIFQ